MRRVVRRWAARRGRAAAAGRRRRI
uniref:Uncharacterized protein n=1 Tax=Arundo donax TaxID=35708 RepID=A0A0A8XSS1_ARUDO